MVIIRQSARGEEKSAVPKDASFFSQGGRAMENGKDFGIAVDIGTTTVAMSLFSLGRAKCLKSVARTNEQSRLGADVMTRIMNAKMGRGQILHDIATGQIEDMADEIRGGICGREDIVKMTVVGNPTMCHLFLNEDVGGLAGAPFKAAYEGSVKTLGKNIGLKKYENIEIYVVSGVSAHVGADAVCVLCDRQIFKPDAVQLAVDIGTNAEILLNCMGHITACSAAAGPAFEGGGIKCGMRADAGAVNGLKINKANGNIVLDVIDGEAPRGLCGSGLADAVSQLLRIGVLKPDGYLMGKDEARSLGLNENIKACLEPCGDGNQFAIYGGKEKKIAITQKDIRNVQLASAAIHAGIELLLEKAGVSPDAVDEMHIAGAFGGFLHVRSAMSFGLYPSIDEKKIKFAGNAAGSGAGRVLLDMNFRMLTEKYAKKISHVELAQEKGFQAKFLNAMELKPW